MWWLDVHWIVHYLNTKMIISTRNALLNFLMRIQCCTDGTYKEAHVVCFVLAPDSVCMAVFLILEICFELFFDSAEPLWPKILTWSSYPLKVHSHHQRQSDKTPFISMESGRFPVTRQTVTIGDRMGRVQRCDKVEIIQLYANEEQL